jgi:hypothetical protein
MTTQTVHVRINDAATGQPTPCRVRFTVGSRYFAPFGRLAEFNPESTVDIGGNVGLAWEWAYIDGTCEIGLPPGEIRIEISKGPEYRPIDTRIQLTPGKLSLRLSIERWADLRAEGWHSGDTRCYHLSPQAALLEGAGEDLAVINLLAHEREGRDGEGRAIPNILDFSGQRPAAELPGHMVVVNTANEHDTLGRLLLLNCHRVVYPLRFGWPLSRENWTLRDWCDQCHRKGGLVIADCSRAPSSETASSCCRTSSQAESMLWSSATSPSRVRACRNTHRPACGTGTACWTPEFASRSPPAARRRVRRISWVGRGHTPG